MSTGAVRPIQMTQDMRYIQMEIMNKLLYSSREEKSTVRMSVDDRTEAGIGWLSWKKGAAQKCRALGKGRVQLVWNS